MPTILRHGRFRFFFYSNESNEPPHVHIRAGGDEAKYWLEPLQLAANYGFNSKELGEIEGILLEHRISFIEAWNEYFG